MGGRQDEDIEEDEGPVEEVEANAEKVWKTMAWATCEDGWEKGKTGYKMALF